jgi:hypothetical protein
LEISQEVLEVGFEMSRHLFEMFALCAVGIAGVMFAVASASQPVAVTALAPTTGLSTGQIVQLTAGGPWLTVVKPETGTPPTVKIGRAHV